MRTSALGNSQQATTHVHRAQLPAQPRCFSCCFNTYFSFHLMFLERTTLTPLRGPRGGARPADQSFRGTLVCVKGADLEDLFSVCTQDSKCYQRRSYFRSQANKKTTWLYFCSTVVVIHHVRLWDFPWLSGRHLSLAITTSILTNAVFCFPFCGCPALKC